MAEREAEMVSVVEEVSNESSDDDIDETEELKS